MKHKRPQPTKSDLFFRSPRFPTRRKEKRRRREIFLLSMLQYSSERPIEPRFPFLSRVLVGKRGGENARKETEGEIEGIVRWAFFQTAPSSTFKECKRGTNKRRRQPRWAISALQKNTFLPDFSPTSTPPFFAGVPPDLMD